MSEMSLNQRLRARGFESFKNGRNNYTKGIRRISDGKVIAEEMFARDAWAWLETICTRCQNEATVRVTVHDHEGEHSLGQVCDDCLRTVRSDWEEQRDQQISRFGGAFSSPSEMVVEVIK